MPMINSFGMNLNSFADHEVVNPTYGVNKPVLISTASVRDMDRLVRKINQAVDDAGGVLSTEKAKHHRIRYKELLKKVDTECLPPEEPPGKPKRGWVKRSKARNLLERLRDYEDDVLQFMENTLVPFTNNLGENDIRMTKVQ